MNDAPRTPQEAKAIVDKARRRIRRTIRWGSWLCTALTLAAIWLWTKGWGGQFLMSAVLVFLIVLVACAGSVWLDEQIKDAKKKVRAERAMKRVVDSAEDRRRAAGDHA